MAADETPEVAPKKGKKTDEVATPAVAAAEQLPAEIDYADGQCLGVTGKHILRNGFEVNTF